MSCRSVVSRPIRANAIAYASRTANRARRTHPAGERRLTSGQGDAAKKESQQGTDDEPAVAASGHLR